MRMLIATARRKLSAGVEKYLQVLAAGQCARGHDLGLLYEYQAAPAQERIDRLEDWKRTWYLADEQTNAALASIAEWNPGIIRAQSSSARRTRR